ncbi:MAG: C25 family cysteine peptidase, partial [Bacteroidota bacterium]|nr:C25 family cysteine peptidase [Bacteroidota bacterium]
MKINYPYILLIVFLVFLPPTLLQGQYAKRKLDLIPTKTGMSMMPAVSNKIKVKFALDGIQVSGINTPEGEFTRLSIKGFSSQSATGYPELPSLSKLIEIPDNAIPEIRIVSKSGTKISLSDQGISSKIYPKQASRQKNTQAEKQKFSFKKELYAKDSLFREELIQVQKTGIMRGRNLALITVSPIQYNPLKNELIVYSEMEVEIVFKGSDISSPAVKSLKYYSLPFEAGFSKILNYETKGAISGSDPAIKYLILSDTVFREALRPFVEWKTRKGFEVIELYKGENGVGTTAAEMKEYLSGLYHSASPENPAFTYLLIVGDNEQIPAFWTGGHISDLPYAEYDGGGDYIPDVYYGRFSAQDTSQLIPQIEKTLEYEQYLFPDPSFLNEAVMIAGVDGYYAPVWGNGQINYGTQYYFNQNYGIHSHTYLYPASGSSDSIIRANISNGVGFVNYTGHGEWYRWLDPTFHISHIPELENKHKYPLMIGNGCVTTVFNIDECFGEALLRAKDKGALGYIGCSDESYWDEDYWWAVGAGPINSNPSYEETGPGMYDLSFHDNGELKDSWAQTQSQYIFAGNMAVTEGNLNKAKYYWEIYHLLGDPSLMVYFSVPDTIRAEFPSELPLGTSKLQIITEPGIYAGLSQNNQLLAAGFSNSFGLIDLNLDVITSPSEITLVLTGQNLQPTIAHINITPSMEPFITVDTIVLNDSRGNRNNLADFGEIINFDLKLENLGLNPGKSIFTVLTCSKPGVQVIDSIEFWGNMDASGDTSISNVFEVLLPDSITDQENLVFTIGIIENSKLIRKEYFQLKVAAPDLEFGKSWIGDGETGNGNSRLDPGEVAKLWIEIINHGNSDAKGISVILTSSDTLVQVLTDSVYIPVLSAFGTQIIHFDVQVDSLAPPDSANHFKLIVISEPYSRQLNFYKTIGFNGQVYDDFESGSLESFNWIMDANHPWEVTEDESYQGSFSACSGLITHSQYSSLSYEINFHEQDTISFYYKVSSEANYDFLNFYIDTLTARWSGNQAWQFASYPVEAGPHILKWTYSKDSNTSSYKDKAWIDFVKFPANLFETKNIGLQEILNPVSKNTYSGSEIAKIKIRNFGNDTISNFAAGYLFDQDSIVLDTIYYDLLPDSSYVHTFGKSLDLSQPRLYDITFFSGMDYDSNRRNDTIKASYHHLYTDIGIMQVTEPVENTQYSSSEDISLAIVNYGTSICSEIPLHFLYNNNHIKDTVFTQLLPGERLAYTFSQSIDMEAKG